jgi:hypothetical protein
MDTNERLDEIGRAIARCRAGLDGLGLEISGVARMIAALRRLDNELTGRKPRDVRESLALATARLKDVEARLESMTERR